MGATVIVDAFWGDSGKGKISAYFAKKLDAFLCVRAGTGTNAGHSIYFKNGNVIKTHQLPCGFVNVGTMIGIGSGVAVNPNTFLEEIEKYNIPAVIDYRCPIILPEYIEEEQGRLKETVGSTASGTGVALAEFRQRRAKQAKDIEVLQPFIGDVAILANDACEAGFDIIVEGSQGTFLSLALGSDYPYCTSDNCTTAAFIDDVGLSWKHVKDVVLVVKTMPTRVGPGALPHEMSAETIRKKGIAEYGVTTGRLRRKADHIDMDLLAYSVMLNGPTKIALTFCDHYGIMQSINLATIIEKRFNIPVTIFDNGKYFEDIQELEDGVLG